MAKFEKYTYTAPACWAPYLINGDSSGIEESDIEAADRMLYVVGLGGPVSCSDEPEFLRNPDFTTKNEGGFRLAADCLTYTFLKQTEGE